jgi:PmbA protein
MKELAIEILHKLKREGFDQSEVRFSEDLLTEIQIDADQISLMRSTENVNLNLKGLRSQKYASLDVNQIDPQSIEEAIGKLKNLCEAAIPDEARQFAPAQGPLSFKRGDFEPNLLQMHSRIQEFVEGVKASQPETVIEQSSIVHKVKKVVGLNSRDLFFEDHQAGYHFGAMFSSKRGNKVSSFNYSMADKKDLKDPLRSWGDMDENLKSSLQEIDHQPVKGQFEGELILPPGVFAEFLSYWSTHLGDLHLIAGTSRLKDKMNQLCASPLLTFKMNPHGENCAFHDNVTPDSYKSSASTVIEKGVLKTFLLSDYGARKTQLPRHGNSSSHWDVVAGSASKKELLQGIKRGIWVGRFSGGMPAANGDFSGVAKNSYLIENGEKTHAVSEVMISGNVFDLIKSISAVSQDRTHDGRSALPWVRVSKIKIVGQS